MVAIGGVVAFLADRMGRKLGKKRLSFLGMRPRKTATFFTVAAGVAIPLITVAMVAGLSQPVRTWLLEGRQAIEEARQLRAQRQSLSSEIQQLQGQLESVEKQRLTAQQAADLANRRRTQLDAQVKDLAGRVAQFQTRVADIQSRYLSTRRKLDRAERQLVQDLKKLNLTVAQRNELESSFREARRQRDEAYRYLDELQQQIEENMATIRQQTTDIGQINASKIQLEKDFETQRQKLLGELTQKQRELDEIARQLREGEAELARVNEGIQGLLAMNEGTRTRSLIYNARDEVARMVVDPDLSMTQARNALNSLLRSARIAAEANGAKGSARVPAAAIFSDNVEEQTGKIVATISGIPESRILVARAHWNSFAGEPVPLDIVGYPNRLAFRANDVIGETRIDGDHSAAEVIRMLSNWLGGDVRSAVLKAGLVPVAGRDDALANVPPEQVFDLVAQIKSQSRTARVQALASADTYAAGPLQLTFRIR